MVYNFANILFSGQCNLRCPDCIGHNRALRALPNNLKNFPLRGQERFVQELQRNKVTQISFTGTNTDPQLYAHETKLLDALRAFLPDVKISLHTNGILALQKMNIFNRYDRACISFPSFSQETYFKMTGSHAMPDLAAIIANATIPIKMSVLLTPWNAPEIPLLLGQFRKLGLSRVVLRKRYGDSHQWNFFSEYTPVRRFAGNPVYSIDGLEVTCWDFSASVVTCLNLFSDGTISQKYQLTRK